MSKRIVWSCLVIGVAAMTTSSCSKSGAAAEATPPDTAPAVAVAKVVSDNLSQGLVMTAEFKPYQEIDVMAKVAGYVKEIRVDVGDRVKTGELLATLEIPEMADDLNHANSSVNRSKADVVRTQDELTRAQSAHDITHLTYLRLKEVEAKKPGLIAQQEIDDAKSKDMVSEAQVSAAKSALAVAQQQVDVNNSDVQRVRTMMEYTRVTAPFAGVITRRFADTGSMIQAGTASQTQAMPLVRLSQNSRLRLILPVPESAVPSVHTGQRVEVKVPTLNRSFPGVVARFAEKLSSNTRTMETEVDVDNPTLLLIPGMYAEVNLTLNQRNKVLTIPLPAVDMEEGKASSGSVMVVTPRGTVEPRKIALGLETPNRVEVKSGLNEGDMVVLAGRASLQPGQEVRAKVTTMEAR